MDTQVKLIDPMPNAKSGLFSPQNIEKPKIPGSRNGDRTPLNNRSSKFDEFRARSSSVMGPLKTPINEAKK